MLASFTARTTRARLRAVAVAALSITMLSAATCGGDEDIGEVSGTYELTGVAAGSSSIFVSPATFGEFTSGGSAYNFTSGSLSLGTSGDFAIAVSGTQRPSGTSTNTPISFAGIAGTYVQSGDAITFDPTAAGAANFTGTLSDGGDELRVPVTLTGAGGGSYTLRFEK